MEKTDVYKTWEKDSVGSFIRNLLSILLINFVKWRAESSRVINNTRIRILTQKFSFSCQEDYTTLSFFYMQHLTSSLHPSRRWTNGTHSMNQQYPYPKWGIFDAWLARIPEWPWNSKWLHMFTFLSCSQSLSYVSQTSESALGDQKPSQGHTANKHGDVILSSAGLFAPIERYIEIHKHIPHYFQKWLPGGHLYFWVWKQYCFPGCSCELFSLQCVIVVGRELSSPSPMSSSNKSDSNLCLFRPDVVMKECTC